MVTPYNGSDISQTHHKISALGPTDVWRPNTIPYKSKNHVRTSSNDQHCKNQNELNSPKRQWGSKNAVAGENTKPLCFLHRRQTWNVEPKPTVAAMRWRQQRGDSSDNQDPWSTVQGFWFVFWGKRKVKCDFIWARTLPKDIIYR